MSVLRLLWRRKNVRRRNKMEWSNDEGLWTMLVTYVLLGAVIVLFVESFTLENTGFLFWASLAWTVLIAILVWLIGIAIINVKIESKK